MPSSDSHHTNKFIHGLYVITDTKLMNEENIIDKVNQALKGGAKIVQYRDKVNPHQTKLKLATQLQQLCKSYQAWFIINDDILLAKQVEANGVHIGKDDDDILKARQILGENAIIGISCYNDLQRAKTMQNLGADYVAFGRFFDSKTKPNAPQADIATLNQAKQKLSIPVVAIGGITQDNAGVLIKAGADSIAVIQGTFAQENIQQSCQKLQALFN